MFWFGFICGGGAKPAGLPWPKHFFPSSIFPHHPSFQQHRSVLPIPLPLPPARFAPLCPAARLTSAPRLGPFPRLAALCRLRPEPWRRVGAPCAALGRPIAGLRRPVCKALFPDIRNIHSQQAGISRWRGMALLSRGAQASISSETSPGPSPGSPQEPPWGRGRSPQPAPAHRANPAVPQAVSRWVLARVSLILCVFLEGKRAFQSTLRLVINPLFISFSALVVLLQQLTENNISKQDSEITPVKEKQVCTDIICLLY